MFFSLTVALSVHMVAVCGLTATEAPPMRMPPVKGEIKHAGKPNFPQLFPNPTGQNGYEEYVQAADLATGRECLSYLSEEETPPKDVVLRGLWQQIPLGPDGRRKPSEAIKRLAVRQCWDMLDLVERGNAKPTVDPRGRLDVDTLFPELSRLKPIARLLAAQAELSFADGRADAGLHSLVAGLTLGRKIQVEGVINWLVGCSIRAIAMGGLARRTGDLGPEEARTLKDWATADLAGSNRVEEMFVTEIGSAHDQVEAIVLGGPEALGKRDKDYVQFAMSQAWDQLGVSEGNTKDDEMRRLEAMKPFIEWMVVSEKRPDPLRDKLLTASESYVDQALLWFHGVITRPEGAWTGEQDLPKTGVLRIFYAMYLPMFELALHSAAIDRTRVRLILLHAEVALFKAKNGHLPASLADLNDPAAVSDPLSGKSFQYVPHPDGSYRLWSLGSAFAGEVELGGKSPLKRTH